MRILLLLWLLLGLGLCVHLNRQRLHNEDALAHARTRLDASSRAQAAHRTAQEEQLAHARNALESTHAQLERAKALLAFRLSETPGPTSLTAEQRKRIAQHPENAPFRERSTRREIEYRYGDFIRTCGLSPEKTARLRSLIIEKSQTGADARSLIEASGGGTPRAAKEKTIDHLQAEIDEEIFALLGPELIHCYKYSAFDSIMFGGLLSSVEARLADIGAPALTPAQRDTLQAAYHTANRPWVPGKERNKVLGSEYPRNRDRSQLDLKVEELAAPALSPEQLAAVAAYHLNLRATTEVRKRATERFKAETHR